MNNIFNSCIGKHVYYLNFIREFGEDPQSCDTEGKTLLFEVIEGGTDRYTYREMLYLLDHGWDVNRLDGYGCTPLDRAIMMANWRAFSLLLNYNPSRDTLLNALNTALQYWGVTWNQKEMNRVILGIIYSLKGMSCQENAGSLESTIEGQAYPYIIPLLKSGYSLPDNMESRIPAYLYDKWEIDLFLKFYTEVEDWTRKFEFTENSPLFYKDGKLHSRPQNEHLLRPKFPRKRKKRIKRREGTLKDIRRISTHSLQFASHRQDFLLD